MFICSTGPQIYFERNESQLLGHGILPAEKALIYDNAFHLSPNV